MSNRSVAITVEKDNNLKNKIFRWFHVRALGQTFLNTFRAPMTDLYHPARPEHSQYPNISRRFRGLLALSLEACTGCKKCERACPNNTIIMEERTVNGKVHRFPGYFAARCMFCGLCEESCDRQFAIRHTDQFEDAGFSRFQVYYGPERMFDLWDRNIQPKIDAGISPKAVPDKKRVTESGIFVTPKVIKKEAEEASE